MGQNESLKTATNDSDLAINPSESTNVVNIFVKGEKLLGYQFVEQIKNDMQWIGYSLKNLTTEPSVIITHNNSITQITYDLCIQESDLSFSVSQYSVSSGMFRALSLLIQVNYLLLSGQPSCLIIDDIGEGLDFSRSTQLIKLLIEKVKGSQIQLIMSTNDQFVMDAVPLEYWQIIQREGNQLKIYNYHNSKAIFDKFEFTGLGNFDFFSSNYFLRTTPAA
jgi:AAA15 family ATPase/GTPase